MISNAGRMVCAVVCAAPETMPSARPEVHHERAEVRDIRHRVGRLRVGDALVRPQPLVLAREPVDVDGIERAQDVRVADVDAELDRAAAHLDLLAEDRQLRDAAREEGGGRAQDAVVIALGQHDVAAVGAGALDQAVLEHQRGHDGGPGDAERHGELLGVDVPLEHRQRGVVAALGVGGEPPARVHHPHGRVVRAEVGRDDRHVRGEAVDEAVDVVGQRERAVQHDAGDRGEGAGGVRQQRRQQHLGAIGGDDHDRPLGEPRAAR